MAALGISGIARADPGLPAVYYLNFSDGTTSLKKGYDDDAATNTSFFCGGAYPVFTEGDKAKRDVVAGLVKYFADFNIVFTTRRPPSGDYSMLMVGPAPAGCSELKSAAGVGFTDCGNRNKRNISFAMAAGGLLSAQEMGHTFGLDHVDVACDVMGLGYSKKTCTDLSKWGFRDEAGPTLGTAYCGASMQNSRKKLEGILGLWPGGAKPDPWSWDGSGGVGGAAGSGGGTDGGGAAGGTDGADPGSGGYGGAGGGPPGAADAGGVPGSPPDAGAHSGAVEGAGCAMAPSPRTEFPAAFAFSGIAIALSMVRSHRHRRRWLGAEGMSMKRSSGLDVGVRSLICAAALAGAGCVDGGATGSSPDAGGAAGGSGGAQDGAADSPSAQDTGGGTERAPDGPREPGPETAEERVVWKWTIPGGNQVYSSLDVGAGAVFAGTFPDGKVYALDAATSAQKWVMDTGARGLAAVASVRFTPGRVVVSTQGSLIALAPETGAVQWKLGSELKGTPGAVSASPDGGQLYFRSSGDTGGMVFRVEAATGKTVWTNGEMGGAHPPDRLVLRKERLFGHSYSGGVFAIEAATGKTLWKKSYEGTFVSPDADADGTRLYIRTKVGKVRALDGGSGSEIWVNSDGAVAGSDEGCGVVLDGDRVTWCSTNKLWCGSAADGKTLWSKPIGFTSNAEPAPGDGRVHMTHPVGMPAPSIPTNMRVDAFDLPTGAAAWSLNVKGPASYNLPGTPRFADGRLYVAAGSMVLCLRAD